ncbi:MAG: hypothetical protein AAF865_16220 [Pseudomonadota bacterium]
MRLLALSALLATAGSMALACPAPRMGGTEIYPTAAVLPANLLRAYIYFPRAMARENIMGHVALLDASGTEVEGAFLSTRYTLWSQDRRRLTVLFDPGRVKTGLAAHDALGRALEEGKSYALVVRGTALDAEECPLGQDVVQSFVAGPPDLAPPAPETWDLALPAQGSKAPLSLDLGTPHDHLSLAYRLRLLDADGAVVPGGIALAEGEQVWRFTPSEPWGDATYTLTIDPRLEDLAGNRPGILFDRPTGDVAPDAVLRLPVRPQAAPR